jgi:hypothetical protein
MCEEKCIICLEQLESAQVYELPECKHKFHQGCINHWFRQGSSKCPLCNNTGVGISAPVRGRIFPSQRNMGRFKILRQQSKKKDANPGLVKEVDKIKKKEKALQDYKLEKKEYQNKIVMVDGESIKIRDIVNNSYKLKNKVRKKEWDLRRTKCSLSERLNIVPIILVIKQEILNPSTS